MGEKVRLAVVMPLVIQFEARGVTDEGVQDLTVTNAFDSIDDAIKALEELKASQS